MKNGNEIEDQREIVSISQKVDRLRSVTVTITIMLAFSILLNGVILYLQVFRAAELSERMAQQTARVDDLIMNISNLTDNSIGSTTEIGNVKQDISTVINMLRDTGITDNQSNTLSMDLKSPLHIQFSCIDEISNQSIDPCTVNVKILEINSVDEFVLDAGQILEVVPTKVRLSISVSVPGYATYSKIFEYTENGEIYPFIINLTKQ